MPEKKGRKRRHRDRRRAAIAPPDASGGSAESRAGQRANGTASSAASDGASEPPALPSRRVRYAGFGLALVTMMFAVLTISDAVAGGLSGIDLVLRVATGVALAVLALVIGALALVPERVRGWLRRD